MIEAIEAYAGLSISQVGLILDIVGFITIFIYGGFQLGISAYIADKYGWYVLPLRIFGALLIVVGFLFQIIGSGQCAY